MKEILSSKKYLTPKAIYTCINMEQYPKQTNNLRGSGILAQMNAVLFEYGVLENWQDEQSVFA